jgi:hypothetical protein
MEKRKKVTRTDEQKERVRMKLLMVKQTQKLHHSINEINKIVTNPNSDYLSTGVDELSPEEHEARLTTLVDSLKALIQYVNNHPKLVHLNSSYLKRIDSNDKSPFLVSDLLLKSQSALSVEIWKNCVAISKLKIQGLVVSIQVLLATMKTLHQMKAF